ncbi:CotH kinase family protein [Paenibacillus hubeiensis]|uniref:CotH kinase family protein n=1 Tax=Paenibacillus hubeiensis TaxID=3077330 RepID=UPI0031BA61C2
MNRVMKRFAAAALSLSMVAAPLVWTLGTSTAYAAEEGSTTSTPAYSSLFEGDRVIDVKVTISDEDWESILASPMDKEYKSVSVEVDGNKLDNVGFSTKGNMTLRSVASMEDSDRYSFRLKFDKYDKTQTLLGLDKMVLNNNYTDPSYLREYLHYEALRSIGMDVPETTFVNLYINGELFGFYTGVESVDDSYLERNYGEGYEDGVLYDTEEKSYLQYEENEEYSTLTKDLGSDKDKTKLKNFIKVLNDMPDGEKGEIESVLDVDSALKYIAGNVVFGNYDSYNGDKGHNYMLYGDANGKFSVVPWDFNMSFNGYSAGGGGRRTTGTTATNTNATTASIDEPVLGISMDSVPMISNLLAVPEYKAKYLGYVNELTDYLEGIQDRITDLSDLIRPYVEADPSKFYTMEQFESNITYSANAEEEGSMGGFEGMTPPEGFEGMTPPDGMTPPEGFEGMTPPDGTTAPTRPDGTASGTADGSDEAAAAGDNGSTTGSMPTPPQGGFGGGQGMGNMAAGSLTTFALNRLANLQEQLGREVTPLPETSDGASESTGTDASSGTSAGTAAGNASSGSTNKDISVTLDGKTVSFPNQAPILKNGRVMVPVNSILEALGAKVTWDKTAKTVTAELGEQTLVIKIGSSAATLNGASLDLGTPAILQNKRTLVPIRLVTEALGMKVDWDKTASQVSLTSS